MGRDRFDQLGPRDLVATLRSLDRRFGSVGRRATADELAEVIERPGPSGESLDVILATVAQGAALVTGALGTSLDATEPVVPSAVFDTDERVFTENRPWAIEAAIDTLVAEATAAADRIDQASASSLSRAVAVTGAGRTTPTAIAQQLAREAIGALTVAERHVDWLESQT